MPYNPRTGIEEDFSDATGLPGAALPAGAGYIKRPSGMIDVPQEGGMADTYYPTMTDGKMDLFSREVPTEQTPATPDAYETLNLRKKLYDVTIETEYHRDMETAGVVRDAKGQVDPNNVDPFLMGVAQQNYMLNKSKADMWYQNTQNKFKLIKEDATATSREQEMAKTALLSKSDDPIPMMSMEQAQKGGPTRQQLNVRLGRFKALLFGTGKSSPLDREEAELIAGNIFGADWDTLPDVVNMLNQKYPVATSQGAAPVQPGLPSPAVTGKKSTKRKKTVKFIDPNGITWDMPADKVNEALRAMPGSKVQ
jgi:hypothetical protein